MLERRTNIPENAESRAGIASPVREGGREQPGRSPVIAQRAAYEGRRWTRAMGDQPGRPLLGEGNEFGARTMKLCSSDARRSLDALVGITFALLRWFRELARVGIGLLCLAMIGRKGMGRRKSRTSRASVESSGTVGPSHPIRNRAVGDLRYVPLGQIQSQPGCHAPTALGLHRSAATRVDRGASGAMRHSGLPAGADRFRSCILLPKDS